MFIEDFSRGKILDLESKLALEVKNGEEAALRYDVEF